MPNTKKLNYNNTRLRNIDNCRVEICQNAQNYHMSYGILVCKHKNAMITFQKDKENPQKISLCFQTGDIIVIYMSLYLSALRLYHPETKPKALRWC